MLKPRSAVQRMRPYSPPTGGRLNNLRLDFNENVVGCSPRVRQFIANIVTEDLLATYPDYDEVRRDLAVFFGVKPSQLLLTNGTDEAIHLLVETFVESKDEVVVLTPSYAMFRFYAELADAELVEVPYRRDNLSFEIDAVLAAVNPRTKGIFISNPNNPTGTSIALNDIAVLLTAAPHACVLIDEAYFEFHGETCLPWIERYDNLFVSRTFSKAFGMAALRVGCIFSAEGNAVAMRKAQSPYSVSQVAAIAAAEAVRDSEFIQRYVEQTLEGRRLIEEALDRLGIRRFPSSANFVLFDAGDQADEIFRRCRDAGVLIRDRRHELPGCLRVTAGPPDQIARFIEILEACQ